MNLIKGTTMLFNKVKPGEGYRVMSNEEFRGARKGEYSDSKYTQNDPDQSGTKWVWGSKESEKIWKTRLESYGEKGAVITKIKTRKALPKYKSFDYPPEGIAYKVPIKDLGKATKTD